MALRCLGSVSPNLLRRLLRVLQPWPHRRSVTMTTCLSSSSLATRVCLALHSCVARRFFLHSSVAMHCVVCCRACLAVHLLSTPVYGGPCNRLSHYQSYMLLSACAQVSASRACCCVSPTIRFRTITFPRLVSISDFAPCTLIRRQSSCRFGTLPARFALHCLPLPFARAHSLSHRSRPTFTHAR